MKINRILLILPLLLAIIISSCDEIDAPYREGGIKDPPDTSKNARKVLIEDYTGHFCVNCPKAHNVLKNVEVLFPDQVITIAVHAGIFAFPNPTHDYDFRTETGTELDNFFAVSAKGLPKVMINRTEYEGEKILEADLTILEPAIRALTENDAEMMIKIDPEYDETNKEINVEIEVEYLSAGAADQYLSVYIVEDGIVSYQKGADDEENYVHNHVLRASMNGVWGDQLASDPLPAAGDKITKNYNYKIKTENSTPGEKYYWKPEKVSIVAFVHQFETTYNILQAEKAKLLK